MTVPTETGQTSRRIGNSSDDMGTTDMLRWVCVLELFRVRRIYQDDTQAS